MHSSKCKCRPAKGLIAKVEDITQFQVILKTRNVGKLLQELADIGVNIEAYSSNRHCKTFTDIKFGTFQTELAETVFERFSTNSLKQDDVLFYTFGTSDQPGLLAQVTEVLECAKIQILQSYFSVSGEFGTRVLLNTNDNCLTKRLLKH